MQSTITVDQVSTTTTFVGNYYEVSGSTITKYYGVYPASGGAGASRVAMSQNGTVSCLLTDQLGSTSITADGSGAFVSEIRYKAWGEVRYPIDGHNPGPSGYTYTGHYSHMDDFGLMFYNARWYDPTLGRFVQADTAVPGGGQGYDRYAYGLNDPVKYTDPTGHNYCDHINNNNAEDCNGGESRINKSDNLQRLRKQHENSSRRCSTVVCEALHGNPGAISSLLTPTDWGWRVGGELSIDLSVFVPNVSFSFSAGANVVYNSVSDSLAANLDYTIAPGVGVGLGGSATTGPIVGWGSSNVDNATSGKSITLGGSAAAELAGAVSASAPLEGDSLRPHVDPVFGVIPATVYMGGGVGAGYASVGVGRTASFFHEDLSSLLPSHWSMWP